MVEPAKPNNNHPHRAKPKPEISIRDHFAGLAMQGLITHREIVLKREDEIAKLAYAIADAMLTCRNKSGP